MVEAATRAPGRPRTPVARDTLLATACAVFSQEGYAGASMSVIAASSGIRKSSLFHHFPSKQALYDEVMVWLLGELIELVPAAVGETDRYATRLDALGQTLVRYLAAHPHAARVLVRELVSGGRQLGGRGREAITIALRTTSAFLREGMELGAIAQQDPDHLALSLAGLHLTYFAAAEVSGELLGRDVFEGEVVREREVAVLAQVRRVCGVGG